MFAMIVYVVCVWTKSACKRIGNMRIRKYRFMCEHSLRFARLHVTGDSGLWSL